MKLGALVQVAAFLAGGLVSAAPTLEERQSDLPERVLDKVRAARHTLSIMGPDGT